MSRQLLQHCLLPINKSGAKENCSLSFGQQGLKKLDAKRLKSTGCQYEAFSTAFNTSMENFSLTEEIGSPDECKGDEKSPENVSRVEQEQEQQVLDLQASEDQKPGVQQP